MPRKLWWWVVGLVLAFAGIDGVAALAVNVIMPMAVTTITPHTGPLMAPICPGNPECG